eukprot:1159145-Pelagomonas_calceolata.AAC.19
MGGMYWRECFGRNVEFGIQRCSLVFWGPDHHTAQMLVDLGPNVYMDEFETPFLLASASFYKVGCPAFCLREAWAEIFPFEQKERTGLQRVPWGGVSAFCAAALSALCHTLCCAKSW